MPVGVMSCCSLILTVYDMDAGRSDVVLLTSLHSVCYGCRSVGCRVAHLSSQCMLWMPVGWMSCCSLVFTVYAMDAGRCDVVLLTTLHSVCYGCRSVGCRVAH